MKFYCDSCGSKYSIADEKVQGKILKVRCKKCAFIITVREPRMPEASMMPRESTESTEHISSRSISWFYSVNGQTFGPYPLEQLESMYASGQVGDASYVWNETFTKWLPVRQVREFEHALATADKVSPSRPTLGAVDCIESVGPNVEPLSQPQDRDPDFAKNKPSAFSSTDDGLSTRLSALRTKLKKPEVPTSIGRERNILMQGDLSAPDTQFKPFTPQTSTSQTSTSQTIESDAPNVNGLTLRADEEELKFGAVPASVQSFEVGASHEIESDAFAPLAHDQVAHDQTNTFGKAHNIENAEPSSDDDYDMSSEESLLVDMGKKTPSQGRKRRVFWMSVAGVAIVCLMIAVWTIFDVFKSSKSSDAEKSTAQGTRTEQKSALVVPTDSKDKHATVLEFGDEVITETEGKLAFDKKGGSSRERKRSKSKAKSPHHKRGKKLALESSKTKLSLRGLGIKSSHSDAFDKALRSSKKSVLKKGSSLKTSDAKSGRLTTSKVHIKNSDGTKTNWSKLKVGSGSGPHAKIRRPSDNIGTSKGGTKTTFASTGLSKNQAKEGFKKVRRSVGSCRQRQISRGLPLNAQKITVMLEIQGSGAVSNITLTPASIHHSEFHNCMKAHRSRWTFAAFGGKPVKIKHTYVMQ